VVIPYGHVAYTIDFVDIATGWTGTKGYLGQRRKRSPGTNQRCRKMLPFPLLGFDSDNGGEFLNYHLFAISLTVNNP